jgi:hypothetical protein
MAKLLYEFSGPGEPKQYENQAKAKEGHSDDHGLAGDQVTPGDGEDGGRGRGCIQSTRCTRG